MAGLMQRDSGAATTTIEAAQSQQQRVLQLPLPLQQPLHPHQPFRSIVMPAGQIWMKDGQKRKRAGAVPTSTLAVRYPLTAMLPWPTSILHGRTERKLGAVARKAKVAWASINRNCSQERATGGSTTRCMATGPGSKHLCMCIRSICTRSTCTRSTCIRSNTLSTTIAMPGSTTSSVPGRLTSSAGAVITRALHAQVQIRRRCICSRRTPGFT
mmetsp:Transcript_13512/g.32083  ORF Transcript_13512/g.32083 Transcript_13512/m.32083 type:complete len:213 (+) Transcript_13512:1151-1789(+)